MIDGRGKHHYGICRIRNYEQGWIARFNGEILAALANARTRVEKGRADAAIQRWFGFAPGPNERAVIVKDLGVFRSNLDVRSISLGFITLKGRKPLQNARAWNVKAPQLDLGQRLAAPGAGGLSTVELRLNFKNLPDYMPTNGDGTINGSNHYQWQVRNAGSRTDPCTLGHSRPSAKHQSNGLRRLQRPGAGYGGRRLGF